MNSRVRLAVRAVLLSDSPYVNLGLGYEKNIELHLPLDPEA